MTLPRIAAAIPLACAFFFSWPSEAPAAEDAKAALHPRFRITIRAVDTQPEAIAYERILELAEPQSCLGAEGDPDLRACADATELDGFVASDRDGRAWSFEFEAESVDLTSDPNKGGYDVSVRLSAQAMPGAAKRADGTGAGLPYANRFGGEAVLKPGESSRSPLMRDDPANHDAGAFHPARPYDLEIARLR